MVTTCAARAGRHQQRVHRVRDVDGAGKRFDRRPLQPMPREVEERHRDAGIDDLERRGWRRAAGDPSTSWKRASGYPAAELPREGAGQLVRVFPDACALSAAPADSR